MKAFVAILLLAGIILQTSAKLAIIINFEANREYIAKNLCEKKDEPDSCCKGSCQLNKSLEEEEESKNSSVPGTDIKEKFETLTCTLNDKDQLFVYETTIAFVEYYRLKKPVKLSNSIFHPPNFTA
jgi:hypothetical protein